jgi:hypothetical protein
MRVGAVAYRWAGVCGTTLNTLVGVGVRCDDEDRGLGESLVVSVLPGKIERRQSLPFAVRAVGGDVDGTLALGEDGRLWALRGGTHTVVREGVRQLVGAGVTDTDGHAWAFRDGVLTPLHDHAVDERAVAIGAGDAGGVVVVFADRIVGFDAGGGVRFSLDVDADGLGAVRAVGQDGDVVVVASTDAVFVVERATGQKRRVPCALTVDCVAVIGQRALCGTSSGLYALDLDDDAVRAFRPSLRAHQLHRTTDGLAIVSDLFIGSSDDGMSVTSRDLSGLIRTFEKGSTEGAPVGRSRS